MSFRSYKTGKIQRTVTNTKSQDQQELINPFLFLFFFVCLNQGSFSLFSIESFFTKQDMVLS